MNHTHLEFQDETISLLSGMIGQRFDNYICDEFLFTPSSYQVVYLTINDAVYALENTLHTVDYYGDTEDVSVFSLGQWDKPCNSRVIGRKTVKTPINQPIVDIKLVFDTDTMSEEGNDIQSITTTKAVLFELPDRQVVFEKDIWFSEGIFVYRGSNVENKIASIGEDVEGEPPVEFRSDRTIVSLAKN